MRRAYRAGLWVLILFLAGLVPLGLPVAGGGIEPVLILTYHRVTTRWSGPVPAVKPVEFARQLDYLVRTGYRSISPDELTAYLSLGEPLPRRAVLITFDDGWADNYYEALPLLRARGFVATIFVISGRVGKQGCLTSAQLRTLAGLGWTIGAHTVSHPHLPAIPHDDAMVQIRRSRAVLTRILGRPVTCFAYPYGDYNPPIRDLVAEAGFTAAFSTMQGLPWPGQDTLAIRRFVMPRHGGLALLRLAVEPGFWRLRRILDRLAGTDMAFRLQEAYSRHLGRRSAPARAIPSSPAPPSPPR